MADTKIEVLRTGITLGLKAWLITGLTSPILFELQQMMRGYNQNWYSTGSLLKLAPIIYPMVSITMFIFFFIPSIVSGIIIGLHENKGSFSKLLICASMVSVFITVIGYGSLWVLFLSKADYMRSYTYWTEFLSMIGMQFLIWLFLLRKFNV
jgi:hypothetical protein